MRLLVVGNSYVTAFAQRKYVTMKQQDTQLELRLLTPRAVPHLFQRYERECAPGLSAEEVVDIREFFGRSHMSYVFDPLHFIRVLREFRPQRIHIEEDPHSAVGVQTVVLARLFCPAAKISFFIWDNLARVPRFPLNVVKRLLTRYCLGRAELVVCGNAEGERLLRGPKGYAGRSAVVPQLGLDPEPYLGLLTRPIREEMSVPSGMLLVGFIGRLIPEKGVLLLLEAMLRLEHANWRLLIIGSGPLEAEIAGHWQQQLGERLLFHRAVPRTDVPDYMKALDILVLPSYGTPYWKEQFGLVLAMAMMSGVPCIGSSSGAIPEVIGPGGLVFEEKNAASLASALDRLLADGDLRRELGATAREFALQHYTHEVVGREYLEIWEDAGERMAVKAESYGSCDGR